MKNKGHIYFIMGTSGSGKGTLIQNLKKCQELSEIYMPLSYKSREKRETEVDGVDSHFISHQEFETMIKNNEFLEYELVYGHDFYYGTKYSEVVDRGIERGKKILKEIDMEGLKQVYKNHPELKEYITTIFLGLKAEKFAERIQARGEKMTDAAFEKRLEALRKENQEAKRYCDYIIDTSEKAPEQVLEEVRDILSL